MNRRTPCQSAYAWLVDAETPAQLAEAGALVASLELPDAVMDRLRGYYRHFAAELARPDAVERRLVQRLASASGDEVAGFWNDNQASLKLLDTPARARVWDEIERRQPPKERRYGRAA